MNREKYYPPAQAQENFHCPHCSVFAKQRWSHLTATGKSHATSSISRLGDTSFLLKPEWSLSLCDHCNKLAIWKDNSMIYPKSISVDLPNKDLSEEIQSDYIEAANVLNDSPRSAAAILRLALQKLCKDLGEKGENINDDIASLVAKGLNPSIQKSLDALRITGNNAVHPGKLNLKEDKERVLQLFKLLNFIAEKMITEPKEIDEFYQDLPETSKNAVEKRDAKI